MKAIRLSPTEIEDRFEEAAQTLRRLPDKNRPGGYGSAWPQIIRDTREAYGYDSASMPRLAPGPAQISRMEECFQWLMWLDDEDDRRIVWLRAERIRWRPICYRVGLSRAAAWRRWAAALILISKRLEKGDQSTASKASRKSVAAKPGVERATGAVRMAQSAADTFDFGRDT